MIDKIKGRIQLTQNDLRNIKYDKRKIVFKNEMNLSEDQLIDLPDEYKYQYIFKQKGFKFIYIPLHRCILVEGRLINFSQFPNRIDNMDTLYSGFKEVVATSIADIEDSKDDYNNDWGQKPKKFDELIGTIEYNFIEKDLQDIIHSFNQFLKDFFNLRTDILNLEIYYIEVCFNIPTKDYERYIELFNLIFKFNNPKSYKNYVFEKHEELHTSFYIKTKGQWLKNKEYNCHYTVNFYNKYDQLQKKQFEHIQKYGKSEIDDIDIERAKDILRLEVQAGSKYLNNKKIRKDIPEKVLSEFINPDWCRNIIIDIYRKFISKNNEYLTFYSYSSAKAIIEKSELKNKKDLLKYILKISKGHKVGTDTKKKYNKQLEELGIHYYFIPSKWGIDKLISPIKLLDDEVQKIKTNRYYYLNPVELIYDWDDDEVIEIPMKPRKDYFI